MLIKDGKFTPDPAHGTGDALYIDRLLGHIRKFQPGTPYHTNTLQEITNVWRRVLKDGGNEATLDKLKTRFPETPWDAM